jgi:exodeoxyribonuclease VII large subunit
MKTDGISYITVSQLNDYVKMLIDGNGLLSTVAVRGEISNFKHHYSGHMYFSLKDRESALRCVMFSGNVSGLTFSPKDGSDVIAFGRISVFKRDGTYQLYVNSMLDAGLGELYAAFERLKKKLGEEGLFDVSRKKKIPGFPEKIGIVTSATGAAVRDMITILGRRWPMCEIFLYPALVQGAEAPASIAEGIRYFNREGSVDTLIIGRGGGSFEDLSCFNDETLARTIASSVIPVISAVGHETDFTIADFVADLRAPTPSAAAELAVPDSSELMSSVHSSGSRMHAAILGRITSFEKVTASLSSSSFLRSPIRVLDVFDERLSSLAQRNDNALNSIIKSKSKDLGARSEKLGALSPLSILSRGFSIVRSNGATVSSVSSVKPGDPVGILFSDGSAEAMITSVDKK